MRYGITPDSDNENPLDDTEWKLHSFCRKHSNFTHPDEWEIRLNQYGEAVCDNLGMKRKLECCTAFELSYFEHGECAWMLNGGPYPPGVEFQWDGVQLAGLLVWHGKAADLGKTHEQRIAHARSVVKEYTQWCNGDIWHYAIYGDDDKILDSCGGCYGHEYAVKEAEEQMKWFEEQAAATEAKLCQEGAGI